MYGLALIAYIVIPTFTPNLMALDTNTPKFFATSLLNLFVFCGILALEDRKQISSFAGRFFSTNVGMVYAFFMAAVLLSFTQAINLSESLLQFMKIFTVFAAVINLTFILNRDPGYIKYIIIVMTGLLLFDTISVFYYINKFISGDIARILDIKTVYSNKNILSSAIFVKLPFALWLMIFEKGWLKKVALVAFAFGITATLFMATRAFYLGFIIISIAFLGFYLLKYFQTKEKKVLWLIASYLGSVIIALSVFTYTQKFLYPKEKTASKYTKDVVQQIASIKGIDNSSKLRLNAWKWSWELIKEKPLLGVGAGNWKIAELKHENQQNEGFIYIYKAHNDFLETTAENGLIGGLLFLAIFGLIFWNFIRYILMNKETGNERYKYYFIAASGVIFYGVDAFFNFPADRPEIQILFALFLSTGIVSILHGNHQINNEVQAGSSEKNHVYLILFWSVGLVIGSFLIFSATILYNNFVSTKTQRIVYQEIMSGKLKEPSDKIINGLPTIPNVSVWGEPTASLVARYLLDEGKNEKTIELLKKDFSSPYDARREFYMATAFNNLKQSDSALHYALESYQLKPRYIRNIALIAELLEKKGEIVKAADYYDVYLKTNKKNLQVYLIASNLYVKTGEMEKAFSIINEAMEYFPNDSLVLKQKRYLNFKNNVEVHLATYKEAMEFYSDKKYKEALRLLNQFIEKVPDDANALQMRSFTNYYLKDYNNCIVDANASLRLGSKNSSLINLRGVSYRQISNFDASCEDFKKAMEMGNPSGKTNYERYCGGK
jgi:O-antigen ligase/tetratricopeptide (TPR) repeat protein